MFQSTHEDCDVFRELTHPLTLPHFYTIIMEETTSNLEEAVREAIKIKVREELDKGSELVCGEGYLCWKISDLCEDILKNFFGNVRRNYGRPRHTIDLALYCDRRIVELGLYDAYKMCLEHGIVPEDIDLRFGIVNGYIKIAELMIDYGIPCDGLVMEVAAKNFRPESIKLLRDYGATLDRFPSDKSLLDALETRKRKTMEDYNKTLEMRKYIPVNPRRIRLIVGN
jgi:hypothetical protein